MASGYSNSAVARAYTVGGPVATAGDQSGRRVVPIALDGDDQRYHAGSDDLLHHERDDTNHELDASTP